MKNEIYEKVIPKLIENVDFNRLLDPEKYQELERIRKNYTRGDVFIAETIDNLFKKIKCQTCDEFFIYKHHCDNYICKTCVKKNNFSCIGCGEPLPHSMIRHFFEISLSCKECSRPSKNGPGPNCGHFCESCLFEGSSQEEGLASEKKKCKNCWDYIKNHQYDNHPCSNCNQYFQRINCYQLCDKHICCKDCSSNLIETGKCACGENLPVSKVQKIYEKTHFACASCKYCFPLTQLSQKECCKREVCKICIQLTCDVCSISTLDLFPR
jgi:hypothetical protein